MQSKNKTMLPINLRHITFKQALVAAKMHSGKTNAEICEASGLSPANVAKYFKEYEAYYPSPCNIPALCSALENSILVDWQVAQLEEMFPEIVILNAKDLTDAAMSITGCVGTFCETVREQVEDNRIDKDEARVSQAMIDGMMCHLKKLRDALEPLASGQITGRGDRHEQA